MCLKTVIEKQSISYLNPEDVSISIKFAMQALGF